MSSRRLIDLTEADLYEVVKRAVEKSKEPPVRENWMTASEAMEYLHMPRGTFYKLTASRQIPFHRDTPKGPLRFKRDELDRWRRGE